MAQYTSICILIPSQEYIELAKPFMAEKSRHVRILLSTQVYSPLLALPARYGPDVTMRTLPGHPEYVA